MSNNWIQLPIEFPVVKNTRLLTVNEIFNEADQHLLEQLGKDKEDRRIERKPAGTHAEALGLYFSMYSNTSPDGGIIVIGQEDDSTLSGCLKVSQGHINKLEQAGDVFCPDARYDIKHVKIKHPNGMEDYVVLIRVRYREDKLVRDVRNNAYTRTGSSKKKLSEDEARELEIGKHQIDFEQEPSNLKYPEDFDLTLIRQFVDAYRDQRKIEDDHSTEDILTLNHLGKIESGKFIPNNACVLIFANDPRSCFPGCKIRFLRFDGDAEGTGEKFNAIKDIYIDQGSIPRQIFEIEKVMDAHIRDFGRFSKDGQFSYAPEYPKLAWYEAIVNACVHRSYSLKTMYIFVKMFDNRLVIESPGGFPPLVTPQNIYEIHKARNPFLMDAMYYLKFVKCAHEGTRRMRDTMQALELPNPEFEQIEISHSLVRVTLRNNIAVRKVLVDKDVSALVGQAISQTLDENERRIINWLAENNKISVSDVQRLTGKTWPASSKLLKGLKAKGIIIDIRKSKKKERDPSARYVLRDGRNK